MNTAYQDIAHNGLWKNNPGLVQLLGLCPLLAVSNSVVNALGLGFATMMVLASSNLCVSLFRHQVIAAIRLPAFVMLIAALTTCAELLMQAYTYSLYQTLGIFIPLIVTNCVLLGRAEGFASKNSPMPALFDGLMMGAGFMLLLVVLGVIREILGTGAIFANLDQLLPFAADWKLQLFATETPFLLAILPPGAFLVLGFLIALKKVIDKRLAQPTCEALEATATVGSKRVRVTGQV
jgi:Na+-translocating ferredoxin:NAD+ oxidoreductase subunit E